MCIKRQVATVTAMTGLFFGASLGTAQADDAGENDRNNANGFAVFSLTNGEADSLLEIDRTLNFNRGSGSAGSDNEWHGFPEVADGD